MRSSIHTIFFLLWLGAASAAEKTTKPSCVDFAKGDFGPETIVSEDICRSACETAEGLPIGDYNKEDGSDYQSCACKKMDATGSSALETRGLCEDGTKGSGGSATSVAGGLAQRIVMGASLATVLAAMFS